MIYYWFFLLSCLVNPNLDSMNGTLVLTVENIQEAKGQIRIGIFNTSSGFPDDANVWRGLEFPVDGTGSLTVELKDLPFGEYAIAAHHDLGKKGKMSKNMFGVPTEPYGFSNGAVAKWGDPRYSDAVFTFDNPGQSIQIKVQPWSDY